MGFQIPNEPYTILMKLLFCDVAFWCCSDVHSNWCILSPLCLDSHPLENHHCRYYSTNSTYECEYCWSFSLVHSNCLVCLFPFHTYYYFFLGNILDAHLITRTNLFWWVDSKVTKDRLILNKPLPYRLIGSHSPSNTKFDCLSAC